MSEIGYYNYYNNTSRYTPDAIIDRYQQMVDRYNSDELHSNNENPYSDENLALRKLDEQLAPMAENVRSKCKTIDEVRHYLGLKYFGQEEFAFTKKWKEPEKYAMYENDLNAICYGTVGGANRQDPRLNFTNKDWDTYEAEQKASKQKIISNQMNNLLENNGITVNDQLLISFNPYSYTASIEGSSDLSMLSKITELLNSGSNSRELMYYTMQTSGNIDADALTKFRAYQNIKQYTGYDLSKLDLKNGEFYTPEGQKITDILKDKLDKNNSIAVEFKGAAYQYTKDLLDKIAEHGWNGTPDLELKIGFSIKDGFFNLDSFWEA